MNDDDLSGMVRTLMGKLDTKSLETQHGAILSLGHLIERKISKTVDDGQNFHDAIRNWEFLGMVVTELGELFGRIEFVALFLFGFCSMIRDFNFSKTPGEHSSHARIGFLCSSRSNIESCTFTASRRLRRKFIQKKAHENAFRHREQP